MVFFSTQAQMLLSKIEFSKKLALPYMTKRCLKCYLGREKSFEKGLGVFRDLCFRIGQFQATVATKEKVCEQSN